MEEMWKSIKSAIIGTGEDILGPRLKIERNEWFDQECIERIEVKHTVCKNCLERSMLAKQWKYKKARKDAKRDKK